MKNTFLAAAASLLLIACGEQTDVVEWMNGVEPQSSVPSMPSAITLVNPSKSPSRVATPTLKISGVKSGLDVYVYKTSSCSTAIKSARATSSIVQIKLGTLANGNYKFYTKAKNKFGYSKCKGYLAYTVDNEPPAIALNSLSLINASNASNYSLSGTCSEDGRNVSLTTPFNSITTCAGGVFGFSGLDLTAQSDSSVLFTVETSDAAGNIASDSDSVSKDTLAPIVSIGNPSNGSINTGDIDYAVTYTGASSINLTASDVTVNTTGTVSFSKSILNGTTANPTIRISVTGGDGSIDSISVAAGTSQDAAGNNDAGDANGNDVTVDNTNPTVSIGAPALINNINKASYSLSGTCSENGDTITITAPSAVNGITTTCASNAFAFSNLDVNLVPDGTVNFTVQIADALNNSSTDSKSANKDATVPSITALSLSSPATSPGNDTTPDIQVSGTFPIGDTFQLFSDATCSTSISSAVAAASANSVVITSSIISSNTTYTYYAKGTDAAGNTSCSGAGVSISYTLDTVLPNLTFTTGANINNVNKAAYAIGGSCNENGRTVYVTAPAGMSSLSATCTSGAWSINSINMTGISDGPITMTVSLTDAAGNARTTNRSITKDTVMPTVAITSLPVIDSSNQYSYTLSGTCTANGDLVYLNAPVSGYSTACSAGIFAINNVNLSGIADGTVNFTVQIQDSVNNNAYGYGSTTKSAGDTTPPTDPTCDAMGGDATPTKSDTVTWTGSSDVSGINHYEMRIYRPSTDKNIVDWTDIGQATDPYRFTGIHEPKLLFNDESNSEYPVVYQTFIRAVDNFGNYSNEVQCPSWHLKPAYGNFSGIQTKNESNPETFNAADLYALVYNSHKFNASYFDHSTEKNPERIVIKENGNYLLSSTVPMFRKNENGTTKIASARMIVKVNDTQVPYGIAANSLAWGKQNDLDNPVNTSNHIAILLESLKENDVVTIETQNNAVEEEQLTNIENQPFSAYLEFIPDEQYKFSAQATELDTGSNLNDGEGKIIWNPSIVDDAAFAYDAGSPDLLNFAQDGDYFIAINVPFQSAEENTGNQKIGATIYIGGNEQKQDNNMVASNGMISNVDGHKISSSNYSTVIRGVKNGDQLQVVIKRMGESGMIQIPHHQPMSVIIYKLPNTNENYLMLSGTAGDWNKDQVVEWTKDYIVDSEVYAYETTMITAKKDGDYLVTANIQLDVDTDYSKPFFYLTKNEETIPGTMCAEANMTVSPGDAAISNCVIQFMMHDIMANDIIRLHSKQDIAGGKSGSPSAPKITIRKLSESVKK